MLGHGQEDTVEGHPGSPPHVSCASTPSREPYDRRQVAGIINNQTLTPEIARAMHLPADQPASMTSSSGGIRISLQGGEYDRGLSVLYSGSTFSRGGARSYRWNTDCHQQASPWCVGGSDGAAVEAYGTLRNG